MAIHYLNQCWCIVNWTLGNNLNEIQSKIQRFSLKKMHLKILSAEWQPPWLCLSELRVNLACAMASVCGVVRCWLADSLISCTQQLSFQEAALVTPRDLLPTVCQAKRKPSDTLEKRNGGPCWRWRLPKLSSQEGKDEFRLIQIELRLVMIDWKIKVEL